MRYSMSFAIDIGTLYIFVRLYESWEDFSGGLPRTQLLLQCH